MPFLSRADTKLFYEVWGEPSSPLVTLINGYTRTHADFKAMGRFLVRRGWRVLAFDNRGAGATEIAGSFTFDEAAQDLPALWDYLEAPQSHLLGISYGGVLAMVTALKYPARVKSLVAVSSSPHHQWFLQRKLAPEKRELKNFFSEAFLKKNAFLVEALVREIKKARSPVQDANLLDINLLPQLSELKIPTLIIHGEKDQIVSPLAAEALAQVIPHAQLRKVPEIGHLLLAETPAKLYEWVADFIESQR